MSDRIPSYKEFYLFYITEHANTVCRRLHFVGTGIVIGLAVYFTYINDWSRWWALPLVGYGFAWVGHFFFEKNKPATFKYPLWSLFSDFKLFFQILTGKLPF